MIWLVPAAVFLVGAVAVLVATGRTLREARGLQRDVARFGEVRLALARVRDDSAVLRRNLDHLRRR